MAAKLFLIPSSISESQPFLSAHNAQTIGHVRVFFVEGEKSARRYLKVLNPQFPLSECELVPFNEHSNERDARELLKKFSGKDIGIISEAGCPCVADPGANVVLWAHEEGREVVPLVGPSSIVLALMASGLNGQNFAFNGYLPKDKNERIRKIKALENRSFTEKQTQIFMETPYRNDNLLEEILSACDTNTLLCVACDLTSPAQEIKTMPVKDWQERKRVLHKRPVLFLIQKT